MSRPSRVRVSGPLAPYVRGFRAELAGQGYGPDSVARQLRLMAQLSSWLGAQALGVAALMPQQVERFVVERRAAGYRGRLSPGAMAPLLDYLRQAGASPLLSPPVVLTPLEQLLVAYSGYLAGERALAERSVYAYLWVARRFLSWRCRRLGGDPALDQLAAADVTAFVLEEHQRGSVASARRAVTALRSLLRYLHVEGHTAGQLAPAVLAVPGWRSDAPHRALTAPQVARLRSSFDRRTALGRRDYAMVMVMVRLGLRAAEVADLALDDVDWRSGEITIPGKGDRRERLPVPIDVGQAIAGYCQRGRPHSHCRALFLPGRAPRRKLSASAVTAAVGGAAARAGLPGIGAHRLRHTAATQLLRAGGSLLEVGGVLRQRRLWTTAVYAKVDQAALGLVARPWPAGAA